MEFRDFREGRNTGSSVDFSDFEQSNYASDELIYASGFIGRNVIDSTGTYEGKIEDFLFSKKKGKLELILVKFKKWKNKSGVYLAVPFKVLEYRGGLEPILIKTTDNILDNAPTFEKAAINDIFSKHYDAIANYWGGHLGSF